MRMPKNLPEPPEGCMLAETVSPNGGKGPYCKREGCLHCGWFEAENERRKKERERQLKKLKEKEEQERRREETEAEWKRLTERSSREIKSRVDYGKYLNSFHSYHKAENWTEVM